MRYQVLVKSSNAYSAWTSRGVYGSESVALAQAQRLAERYAFVRVVDAEGRILWNG
jgi:hypothetical protein